MEKILQINTVPIKRNGMTAVILNYSKFMDKTDLQIDFAAINEIENGLKNEFEAIGKIHVLPMRNKNPLAYILKLSKIIREEKYDAVHAHGNSCTLAVDLFAAKLGGAKKRIAHSHNTKCEHNFVHRILRLPFNSLYTLGLACSEQAGKWLFKSKSFKTLQNAIDLAQYKFNSETRKEFRKKLNLQNKTAIVHIATLTAQKNHKFILEVLKAVLAENENYILFLIGDGELKNDIANRIKELQLENNAVFVGSVGNVSDYLQAMDLAVLPSYYEGSPITIIETQVSGLQTLVSNNVPNAGQFSDLAKMLPLKKEYWIREILEFNPAIDREKVSEYAEGYFKSAELDIRKVANELRKLYENG